MAKANAAVRFFFGSDTYGRPVEVAQRADGTWFCRSYERNRFGRGWTPWRYYTTTFEDGAMAWGWNTLREATNPPAEWRIRLPTLERRPT